MARKQELRRVHYFPNMWHPNLEEPELSFEEDSPFVRFWKKAMKMLQDGIYIGDGQIFVHGWLIWHTVIWRIELDTLLPNGKSFKGEGIPLFRDNEWEVQEILQRCEKEMKGFEWIGARGFGKSNILSSISSYFYTCYHDLEVLLTGPNAGDIAALCAKCEYGLSKLDAATLYKKRGLGDNWLKEVRAGYKDSEGKRYGSNSRFLIRNYAEGENTMAANATRPKVHVIDEIGKLLKFKKCYTDSQKCWMNDFGQFGIPICGGTGGDMDKGADSKEVMLDPIPYNLLEFVDQWEGRKKPVGYFTPVTKARNEYKEPWTLYKYLTEVQHMELDKHEDLERIYIYVSNEEKCMREFVIPRRERAALSPDTAILTNEIAYYPTNISEAFTVTANNKYPVEALRVHHRNLVDNDLAGKSVSLFRNIQGRVEHTFIDDKPIADYPIVSSTLKTGCIIIYEFPEVNMPPLTYIAGADPYNQHKSTTSPSLGTIYIYKRLVTLSGTYQRSIVAAYAGRPETMQEWHDKVELLMDFYDATCLPENEGTTFTQHFEQKNKAHMLADGFDLAKSINPKTEVDRSKGLAATTKNIEFCMNLTYDYVNEKIILGYVKNKDTQEDEPIIRMGYTRIPDIMLLEEMIQYDGVKNCDRIVAFRHMLAYEKSLEKFGVQEEVQEQATDTPVTRIRSPFPIRRKETASLFMQGGKRSRSSSPHSPFYKTSI
jgi:hypothetical protein